MNKKTFDNSKNNKYERKEELKEKKKDITIDEELENMISVYLSQNPYIKNREEKESELEVRFGTKGKQRLNKIDYDNVIKKIKSFGFNSNNQEGEYLLRINSEYLHPKFGYTLSSIRTEITGLDAIQYYCKTNDINKLVMSSQPVYYVKLNKKYNASFNNNKINYINYDDFNFRVSYQIEENINKSNIIAKEMFENWEQTKKSFRYINRVTFNKPNIPINIDLSIVKSPLTDKKGKYILSTNIQDSNIFNNISSYEIELELINNQIGPGTDYKTPKDIIKVLKNTIKCILAGLQDTNYPISYKEQDDVLNEYFKTLFFEKEKDLYNLLRQKTKYFIGPSSYTLQIKNIIPVNENMKIPNIRKNYCVTDKADGERRLMYISSNGKIYLLNSNMNIMFTGAITKEYKTFNSILDGELILNDKNNNYINLFVCFDIYYLNGNDVRSFMFINTLNKEEKKTDNFRYYLLIELIKILNPISILEENNISPIRIQYKNFYSTEDNNDKSIFQACNILLTEIYNNTFEYKTDGLIFTPSNFGVGSNKVGEAGNLKKEVWEYSFKWKPPEFNTIDFLVTTEKNSNNQDVIKSIFQEGINTSTTEQLDQYKIVILRCGFDEKKHGFINPCEDVLNDKLPVFNENEISSYDNYKPVRFYPSIPYDPEAGICHIMLKKDNNGTLQMFSEENEIIEDNTIVEFKYDFSIDDNKFKWVPLRVRYDKTNELKRGKRNFGNDYTVANNNWYSIHNPITLQMITTGNNIPEETLDDDIYYNRIVKDTNTQGLRDFHNLFVKKKLITNVSKKNQTLIDYSCGKGGDFPKWIESKLSFVFGIDISKDNIENRLNGACSRFLNYCKEFKEVPHALFVNGDSSLNIKNGDAMFDEKSKQITKIIFGQTSSINKDIIGKGVLRQVGVGKNGFNISSCQFSIHYFFENKIKFYSFIRNVAETTSLNGYFVGTSYDGKNIFERIKNLKLNESNTIYDTNNEKIWKITKKYDNDIFNNDETCLGYKIGVYQESINNMIDEYLVNYEYLTRILEDFGFILVSDDEAKNIGFPSSTGMFNVLYNMMMNEVNKNNNLKLKYGNALNMKSYEKEISFLNRYFIYKKVREVDSEKLTRIFINKTFSEAILLDNKEELKMDDDLLYGVKQNKINKPKKINKKIILIPGTEALENEDALLYEVKDKIEENLITEKEKIKEKPKTERRKKLIKTKEKNVKLIIEDEDFGDNEEKILPEILSEKILPEILPEKTLPEILPEVLNEKSINEKTIPEILTEKNVSKMKTKEKLKIEKPKTEKRKKSIKTKEKKVKLIIEDEDEEEI
jgi:hypothetical protein